MESDNENKTDSTQQSEEFEDIYEVDFDDLEWRIMFLKMVEALPEHEVYKNHLKKIEAESRGNDALQQMELTSVKTDNYQWGRTTEYQKQLEEFNKFRQEVLEKIETLPESYEGRCQGKKIFKSVQVEINRLKEALPIYAKKSEIIKKIRSNRVIIVMGNTGSGKSTQIMQYLLEIEEFDKKVALGQPQRYSLESIAHRVQEEIGMEVALLPEHANHLISDSRLEIHTHGSLISALIDDHCLSKYSCIILDEAHERFIDSDIALSVLKDALERNPHLRLIITSATADQNIFDKLFSMEVPRIEVSGISYDVKIEYIGSFEENKYKEQDIILDMFREEIANIEDKKLRNFDGNTLIFLPKTQDINELVEKITLLCSEHYEILPFHGRLDEENRRKIFYYSIKPKIIVSTRIGETSITIRNLKAVIDVGRDFVRRFNRETHMTDEEEGFITQSSSKQRAGRTGRTCPGVCYRLYSEEDYKGLQQFEESAMGQYHFYRAITLLKALKVPDVLNFNFLEELDDKAKTDMRNDIEFLKHIDGLDENGEITKLGQIMSECKLEPYLTRILFEAVKFDCADEVSKILALYIRDWKLFKNRADLSEKKRKFCSRDGDFIMLFNIYKQYEDQEKVQDSLGAWFDDNCLSAHCFEFADNIVKDLQPIIEQMKEICPLVNLQQVRKIKIEERILKCFLKGFWFNVCHGESKKFKLCRVNKSIQIHWKSSMGLIGHRKDTQFLICDEITSNEGGLRARIFSRINPEWISELSSECKNYINLVKIPGYYNESQPRIPHFINTRRALDNEEAKVTGRNEESKADNKTSNNQQNSKQNLSMPLEKKTIGQLSFSTRSGGFHRNSQHLSRSDENNKKLLSFHESKKQ